MKWIKNRSKFLNEAKIRDVIFPRQSKEVSKVWGEKYLDYEEVVPTDKIEQGKWLLSEEDKMKVLSKFLECNMTTIFKIFTSLPEKFTEIITKSVDVSLLTGSQKAIFKDFDMKKPTIDQIVLMYDNVFKKLAVSETNATEMVQKGEDGRPIKDEEGKIVKIKKEAGDPIYTNNTVNINSFISDYNRCYRDSGVSGSLFENRELNNLRNYAKIDEGRDYKVDFEIFNKDMYLSISHNPKDILNMSISKFYSSCQHLYGGGYRSQLLGNVFDPNSIPAFLIFETPMTWNGEVISDFLPLSRMIIRNMEQYDDDSEAVTFFDRAYPDRVKDVFGDIIEKYTKNKSSDNVGNYIYTPDIDMDDEGVRDPYMDRLSIKKVPYIGVNTKTLYLNRNYDWSKVKVSPNAKIKELIIETTDIPADLSKIKISLEWVKFKYLTINTLKNFENITTDAIAFDKCKFGSSILKDMSSKNESIRKLSIISCELTDDLDLSQFTKLEELQIIYTVDSINNIKGLVGELPIKNLVISGDLAGDKESKLYLSSLKRKGVKVEVVGPIM